MRTTKDIEYHPVFGPRFIIPAGTKVIPATNLTEKNKYWAENWPGMSELAESWARNYGFLLEKHEL